MGDLSGLGVGGAASLRAPQPSGLGCKRMIPPSSIRHQRGRKQLVAAFGEKAVEAELLRREWLTANINSSIKNSPHHDLFAAKRNRILQIRVKTCGPGEEMQFRPPRNQEITTEGIADNDFTVIVRMDRNRESDQFYIIPSPVVFEAIGAWRRMALATQEDKGHWRLYWDEIGSREARPNYGFATKWSEYRDNWSLLEPT
jgi:hypothetical protein